MSKTRLPQGIAKETALTLAIEALDSGAAYTKFYEWISAQGGDERTIRYTELLGKADIQKEVYAKEEGYIYSTDAEMIGLSSLALGAGRAKKTDIIDPHAGIVLCKKRGDKVNCGERLATLYTSDEKRLAEAEEMLLRAYKISDTAPEKHPLISETVR